MLIIVLADTTTVKIPGGCDTQFINVDPRVVAVVNIAQTSAEIAASIWIHDVGEAHVLARAYA